MEELVLNAISSDSFWVVNKALARAVGIEEAVFVAELLYKYRYWKARGQLDDRGGFFYTSEDIQETLGIGEKPVGRLTKSVLTQDIFAIKKRGVPAKNHWYANWGKLHLILSAPQMGVTGTTLFGVAGEPQTGVAITKESYQVRKTKKNTDGKAAVSTDQSIYRRVIDVIGEAHKHLTGEILIWKGREKAYGQAASKILQIASDGKTEEESYQTVREKCAAYVSAAKTDDFLKKQGLTPLSILSSWNKIHYKPNMLRGSFSSMKKEFPKYKEMTAEEIKTALVKWNKHFTVLEIEPHISPESYKRFTREANGYAPALVDILIEEVHPQKKTA